MEPEVLIKTLGQVIRERRSKLGYSQESFADIVGLHRTYMGAVERGEQNLTLKNLCRVANALNEAPSSLLKDAERQP